MREELHREKERERERGGDIDRQGDRVEGDLARKRERVRSGESEW